MMKRKTITIRQLEENIEIFEKRIKEIGYNLCDKFVEGRRCDAGEGCMHLREISGIKFCWTK
jgi:hypothetical protein